MDVIMDWQGYVLVKLLVKEWGHNVKKGDRAMLFVAKYECLTQFNSTINLNGIDLMEIKWI